MTTVSKFLKCQKSFNSNKLSAIKNFPYEPELFPALLNFKWSWADWLILMLKKMQTKFFLKYNFIEI